MQTRRQPQQRTGTGRFSRSSPAATRSAGRPRRTGQVRTITVVRRRPQKSTAAKALGGLTGMLPGQGPKRRTGGRMAGTKGRAGIALLAGAAGLALKNRDKLTSMIGGARHEQPEVAVAPVAVDAAPKDTPVDAAPPRDASADELPPVPPKPPGDLAP